jgi:hypothetical protein
MIKEKHSRKSVGLARTQGWFFVLNGIWPLVHLRSFLAVTGPKTDLWLVKTIGTLIAVAGVGLLAAARHTRLSGDWKLFAGLFSFGLAAIDIIYVSSHTISPIYLVDAGVEFIFVLGWLALARN